MKVFNWAFLEKVSTADTAIKISTSIADFLEQVWGKQPTRRGSDG